MLEKGDGDDYKMDDTPLPSGTLNIAFILFSLSSQNYLCKVAKTQVQKLTSKFGSLWTTLTKSNLLVNELALFSPRLIIIFVLYVKRGMGLLKIDCISVVVKR